MRQKSPVAGKAYERHKHLFVLVTCIVGLACLTSLAGCRQDMQDQPKFYPQRGSKFYADGRSERPQVWGTVARSQAMIDDYFHTGLLAGKEADGLPMALTLDLMARGQERYNIYCAPCHSRVGNGMGMIVQRGYYPTASFHTERLREAPLGHFFQVMTNGLGAMPNYAAELTPQDRWAVAAYIRALQLSQNAKETDIELGKKATKLSDIVAHQGFSSGFLDAWVTPTKARAATPPAALAMATSVRASGGLTSPSGIPAAAITKRTSAPANSTDAPASSTETAKLSTPVAPPPPKEPVYDLAAGQQVYMRNCAACHQISRAGMPPNIPSMIGIVPKVGAERIRTVIGTGIPTGKPPMPAFPNLTPDDIENLVAFLQTSK